MTTPDNTFRTDQAAIAAALLGGAAAMAGERDAGWEDRLTAAYASLLIRVMNPYSSTAALAAGMLSETAKSFNATRIIDVKFEESSKRAKVTFATPTNDDPNNTDEVRTHRIDSKLGASQMSWLRANKGLLTSGASVLRVYINVETIGPNKKVRVLNWVEISE